MDKRLPLALAICLLILLGWNLLFPAPRAPAPASVAPATTPLAAAADPASAAAPSAPKAPVADARGPQIAGADEPDLVLTVGEPPHHGAFRAVFSNRGGALTELRTGTAFDQVGLKDAEMRDPEHWARLLVPVDVGTGTPTSSMLLRTSPSSEGLAREPLERALWARRLLGTAEAPEGVEFTLAQGTGIVFRKRFLFRPGEEVLHFELELENAALEASPGVREFVFTPGACIPAEAADKWTREPQAIAYSRGKGDATANAEIQPTDERGTKIAGPFPVDEPLSFLGVYNKYFAVLLHGSDDTSRATLIGASWRGLRDEAWARAHPEQTASAWRQIVADAQLRLVLPPLGEKRTFQYDLYAGPKERSRLEASWPDHSKLIDKDLGFFSGIASVLLAVLGFFERLTGNWGVAIILLTISVRLLLFPVNRKSQTTMARYQSKMKRLQPRIDEIKKRYAKDPTAQRQEQAKLMQEEGAFPPLGGCLPMFLQIPVFIGLFAALRSSFDLRHAPFGLWIHDLAVPDRLLRIGLHLPLLGPIEYLNLLPLLMVVLWIWQQKGMPMPADEQAAKMQKMMMWMPVMMGFFLYNYAAGLSLYMITQSGLGIIEQKLIKKIWPLDDKERPKKKNGFMARLMEAQQQQMKQRERTRKKPRGEY
ncbi:MAG TPA: membrane protein insertase YidC [Planctomycetota bacterium]|nr:membrane protein insertase YidC [Planctomycetota bacterium]